MGTFFSNVHIRKKDAMEVSTVQTVLFDFMVSNGYHSVENKDEADVTLCIYNPEGAWISVSSDAFELTDEKTPQELYGPLFNALKTDVLAIGCFDSDYIYLNLINEADGIDAWASVGPAEVELYGRRTGFSAWEKKVTDIETFKAAFNEEYVFAEEVLVELEGILDLPVAQGMFCQEFVDEFDDIKNVQSLFFALPEETSAEDLPVFAMPTYDLTPCKMGEFRLITAVNRGGASQGIAIAFSGDYVKSDEITFQDVQLEYDFHNSPRKVIPITLEKQQKADGSWRYYWQDPQFNIPPKVKDGLSEIKTMNEEYKREFGIRFTPLGNSRKRLDICVHFIPLENWPGQCGWCVWRSYDSKKAYIESNNEDCLEYSTPEYILDSNDFDI